MGGSRIWEDSHDGDGKLRSSDQRRLPALSGKPGFLILQADGPVSEGLSGIYGLQALL